MDTLYLVGPDENVADCLVSLHRAGDRDPWIGPRSADRVMQLYPEAVRIRLDAGHW